MEQIGVRTAAKVSGFPWGNLGSMTSRGQIPPFPYSPADVCSLTLAHRLTSRGMKTEPACAVAFAMRDEWVNIVVDDSDQPDHLKRRWVAVAPSPKGDAVPFIWNLFASTEDLVDFIATGEARGGVFLIDAAEIVREVLTGLLISAKEFA